MTVYTTLPTDDSNLEVELTENSDLVTLNINPAQVTGSGGALGTVTNVATGTGLTGGPITTSGTLAIDTTSDITFNSVTADFFGVQHFTAKARETISAGQPVYISGHSGNTPEVMVADFDDPAKMPAFGIASADIANNNNGSISTYGDLKSVDTTGSTEGETWAVGDELFVNNSKLTNTRPTGSGEEVQKIAKIIRVHAQNGQLFLMGAGRSNDTPNLAHYNVFIGNAGGVEKRQLTYTDILATPDLSSYITADSTDTLTNKSGNISQWTNDAGYITSETDNQTLSFANPNLSISNGNSVDLSALTPTSLAWSAITSTPTTLSGYGITDAFSGAYADLTGKPTLFSGAYADLTGKPTIPTQTTINNNANNRVITGSDTADTLEGESNFTWDGSNGLMSGTSDGYDTPILHLKTDTAGYNKTQLLCEDDNGKVFAQVGQLNTAGSLYQWNITLDPDNTHGRSGATTFAGDYFVSFEKNYSNQSAIAMTQNVYGANDGFTIKVRDDFNSGGGNQYGSKPLVIDASELIFKNDNGDEYAFPNADGTNGQAITTDGNGNLTFTTVSGGGGGTLGGLSDVDIQNVQNNDLLMYNSTASEWQNTNLGLTVTPTLTGDSTISEGSPYTLTVSNHATYDDPAYFVEVYTGSTLVVTNDNVTNNNDGTFSFIAPATGSHEIRVRAQDFGDLQSEQATKSLTTTTFGGNFRYWKFAVEGSTDHAMIDEIIFYDTAGQSGTTYPTSYMTSNNTPTPYVASTPYTQSGYDPYECFAGNTGAFSGWWSLAFPTNQRDGAYLTFDNGSDIDAKSFRFHVNGPSYFKTTQSIAVYGSATGAFSGEETLLGSVQYASNNTMNLG